MVTYRITMIGAGNTGDYWPDPVSTKREASQLLVKLGSGQDSPVTPTPTVVFLCNATLNPSFTSALGLVATF